MLRALSVALQGLAPFPLSAISIAVQGFIAWAQEERRQKVNGSGGRKLAAPQPAQAKQQQDDDLIRQVIDKWDVIEAARALDEIRAAGSALQAPEDEIVILTPGVKPVIEPDSVGIPVVLDVVDAKTAKAAEINRFNTEAIKIATAHFSL